MICNATHLTIATSVGPQSDQFGSQLDRLATLIDKLEGKVSYNMTCSFTLLCCVHSGKIGDSRGGRNSSRDEWHRKCNRTYVIEMCLVTRKYHLP